MIKTEMYDKNIVKTFTNSPNTILFQKDTGIRYGAEVYDPINHSHIYEESPMTEEELKSNQEAKAFLE